MSRRCLIEKLEDEEYIETLSEKQKKQLLLCKELLSEDELSTLSSISVAYTKARQIYVEEYLKELNPEMYKRIKEGETIPIFSIFDFKKDKQY